MIFKNRYMQYVCGYLFINTLQYFLFSIIIDFANMEYDGVYNYYGHNISVNIIKYLVVRPIL